MDARDDESETGPALTTFHVRRARDGDERSITWVIERFSPFLLTAAQYRLGKILRELYDPDDVVQDVWLVTLPKLKEISPRDERFTPVLLKFLSTTLRHKIQHLLEKHVQGKPRKSKASSDDEGGTAPVDELEARVTTILRRLERREAADAVGAALQQLEDRDREIIVLRGIEQHAYKDIGTVLNVDPKILAVRYQRALEKLRRELPGSIVEEMKSE